MMTDLTVAHHNIDSLIEASERHFAAATDIWNSFGVGSPQLQTDAAKAALVHYLKAAELLDLNNLATLSGEARLRLLAFRERVLAQAATMKQYAATDYKEQIKHLQDTLDHLKTAANFLSTAQSHDEALLFRVKMDALHTEGCQQVLFARVAARESRMSESISLYSAAEEKFNDQMVGYESQNPELIAVGAKIKDSLKKSVGYEDEGNITSMSAHMILMRFDEPYQPLSDEDMYRRGAANLYSSAASRCNLEALQILEGQGSPRDIEAKLTESIDYVYLAMEAFPANLELHRDLINVWRIKGERFGCPFVESESAFHTRCPIAIKEFAGKWYTSPTLEYDSLACTVCDKDILECSHLPGQAIDGVTVRYQRRNLRITSASLVDVPEDPRCRIEWLSLPKNRFPPRSEPSEEFRCVICQRAVPEPVELSPMGETVS